MITSLIGTIPATTADMVDNKTKLRFVDRNQFKTPEALIIHEQQIISDDKLLDACCMEYNLVLYTPQSYYVPKDVLDDFEQYACVVINYDAREREVTLGIMPENKDQIILSDRYKIKRLLVPIYYYVDLRTKEYGEPDFLNELGYTNITGGFRLYALGMADSQIRVYDLKTLIPLVGTDQVKGSLVNSSLVGQDSLTQWEIAEDDPSANISFNSVAGTPIEYVIVYDRIIVS